MYKSKKQLKQKIEELEKENRILRQTLEKYTKETIIDCQLPTTEVAGLLGN